ncbi:hypothetical protein [Pseudanabaena sp. FACHB-2040]|uniref:hypothetical protein n=1 Tax=Pseudanabaena sp. FACHB-2040 TaxID=2692859 RepID=UPI001682E166|nr:hypothetical protein [Pseudanabaena sp. FACHB-2040]MBD2259481.1 hypothetical protein [Pseudanabaena sp. FACHB-2040]
MLKCLILLIAVVTISFTGPVGAAPRSTPSSNLTTASRLDTETACIPTPTPSPTPAPNDDGGQPKPRRGRGRAVSFSLVS